MQNNTARTSSVSSPRLQRVFTYYILHMQQLEFRIPDIIRALLQLLLEMKNVFNLHTARLRADGFYLIGSTSTLKCSVLIMLCLPPLHHLGVRIPAGLQGLVFVRFLIATEVSPPAR